MPCVRGRARGLSQNGCRGEDHGKLHDNSNPKPNPDTNQWPSPWHAATGMHINCFLRGTALDRGRAGDMSRAVPQ